MTITLNTAIDFSTATGYTLSAGSIMEIADGVFKFKSGTGVDIETLVDGVMGSLVPGEYLLCSTSQDYSTGIAWQAPDSMDLTKLVLPFWFESKIGDESYDPTSKYSLTLRDISAWNGTLGTTHYSQDLTHASIEGSLIERSAKVVTLGTPVSVTAGNWYFIGVKAGSGLTSADALAWRARTNETGLSGEAHVKWATYTNTGAYSASTAAAEFSVLSDDAQREVVFDGYAQVSSYAQLDEFFAGTSNLKVIGIPFEVMYPCEIVQLEVGMRARGSHGDLTALEWAISDDATPTKSVVYGWKDASDLGLTGISGDPFPAGAVFVLDSAVALNPGTYWWLLRRKVSGTVPLQTSMQAHVDPSIDTPYIWLGEDENSMGRLGSFYVTHNTPLPPVQSLLAKGSIRVFCDNDPHDVGSGYVITPAVDASSFNFLRKLEVVSRASPGSFIRVFVSFDNGTTWRYWKESERYWVEVPDYTLAAGPYFDRGMTPAFLASLEPLALHGDLGYLDGTRDQLKFLIAMRNENGNSTPSVDFVRITYDPTAIDGKIGLDLLKEAEAVSGTLAEEPSWPLRETLYGPSVVHRLGNGNARVSSEFTAVRSRCDLSWNVLTYAELMSVVRQFSDPESVIEWTPAWLGAALPYRRVTDVEVQHLVDSKYSLKFQIEECTEVET